MLSDIDMTPPCSGRKHDISQPGETAAMRKPAVRPASEQLCCAEASSGLHGAVSKSIIAGMFVISALLGSDMTMAQSPSAAPAPIPSLVSSYLQALIGYAGYAAAAVQCGLRPKSWADIFHNQITSLLQTHAGSPIPNFTPEGKITSSAHVPSDAEKSAASAALNRKEEEGRYQASQPYARAGQDSSYCMIVRNMALADLDDYVSGTASLWPDLGQ